MDNQRLRPVRPSNQGLVMSLKAPDYQYWRAAVGYVDLACSKKQTINSKLREVAKGLAEFQPNFCQNSAGLMKSPPSSALHRSA
jgi:hypothetical protein